MMQQWRLSVAACVCLVGVAVVVEGSNYYDNYDYEYSYGDESFQYEDSGTGPDMPLCCPKNTVLDINHNCSNPPESWNWRPFLSGEPKAHFVVKGFPKCKNTEAVALYQKEVFFNDGDAFVPRYIHVDSIPPSKYCVTKVYDATDTETCEMHQTKVFVCIEEKQPEPGLYWTGVGLAHLFLFLTLLAFFFVRDLRCLQGQYMICFLISLLLYNICLFPGSVLTFSISYVSCVSLGAIKYFFFCGVMLWFNVICFDVWRTLKNRQDIGSRKRFLCYSVYTWVMGAVLTTAVLVLPYVTGKDFDSDLMESPNNCKLKTEIKMILQLVETALMVFNLVFMILAYTHICKYPKFGNGLPRCEATHCLKQGWKLLIIMIVHTLYDIPDDILKIEVVDLWRFVMVESLAIFAVFAYRKTVIKAMYRAFCRVPCGYPEDELSSVQEKDQLTTMH